MNNVEINKSNKYTLKAVYHNMKLRLKYITKQNERLIKNVLRL